VAGYHLGWWDADGRETGTGSGGKALRPALTILSAQAVEAPVEHAVPAAAVELVHNFSLLHDDIMDADRMRRHRPTAWSVFGVPAAILAGDALLSVAVQVLATQPAPDPAAAMVLLTTSLVDLANGQTDDLAFEQRTDIQLDQCTAMAARKTASLLGCACALGASLAGAPRQRVENLRLFGHHLGIAFQLVDDVLGIWGDPALTGKPVCADLRARKKTLPVVAALGADGAAARRFADLYRRPGLLTDDQLAEACELIEQAGGRTWAQQQVDVHLRAALSHLSAVDPVPAPAEHLTVLAELITRRTA